MNVEEKYKDANENQQAIDLLPEIVTFLASIASADNHTYNADQAAAALAELADKAENLKFRMGYGY